MFSPSASNHIQNHSSGKPHESDGKRKRSCEVKHATAKKKHPFRFGTSSTVLSLVLLEPVPCSLCFSPLTLYFVCLVLSARMRMMYGQNIPVLQEEHTFIIRSSTSRNGRDLRVVWRSECSVSIMWSDSKNLIGWCMASVLAKCLPQVKARLDSFH